MSHVSGRSRRPTATILFVGLLALVAIALGAAWLLRPTPVPLPRVRSLDPEDVKVDPDSGVMVVADELLAWLSAGTSLGDFQDRLAQVRPEATVVGWIPRARIVQVKAPPGNLDDLWTSLESLPEVDAVHANEVWQAPPPEEPSTTGGEPSASRDWGLRAIHAPEAWKTTRGEAGVVLAVLDDGVDRAHEAIRSRVIDALSVFDDAPVVTPARHGTHVTVTAAGRADLGLDRAGVAPGVSVLAIQVVAPRSMTMTTSAAIAAGLETAWRRGARVVNLSLEPRWSPELIERYRNPATRSQVRDRLEAARNRWKEVLGPVLRDCAAHHVVVVAAAGNGGLPAELSPLCWLDQTICVGAVTPELEPWEHSNHGPAVDVAAPGVEIWSGVPGDRYEAMSGTSMAAPHAAGVAALVLSIDPDLAPEDVRNILARTGHDLDAPAARSRWVGRLLDAAAAVRAADRHETAAPPLPPPEIPETRPTPPPSRPPVAAPAAASPKVQASPPPARPEPAPRPEPKPETKPKPEPRRPRFITSLPPGSKVTYARIERTPDGAERTKDSLSRTVLPPHPGSPVFGHAVIQGPYPGMKVEFQDPVALTADQYRRLVETRTCTIRWEERKVVRPQLPPGAPASMRLPSSTMTTRWTYELHLVGREDRRVVDPVGRKVTVPALVVEGTEVSSTENLVEGSDVPFTGSQTTRIRAWIYDDADAALILRIERKVVGRTARTVDALARLEQLQGMSPEAIAAQRSAWEQAEAAASSFQDPVVHIEEVRGIELP